MAHISRQHMQGWSLQGAPESEREASRARALTLGARD